MVRGAPAPVGWSGTRGMARGRNPAGQPARGHATNDIKREGYSLVCRSLPLPASSSLLLWSVLPWPSDAFASGASDGVQLRGHRGGGRQVPRPRARARHDAHRRRGVVAQDDAEELVVRVVRRPQVRVCAAHSRRVLQVPSPPHHRLPRPARPPGVAAVAGHQRVLVAVILPHRRAVVTSLSWNHEKAKPNRQRRGEERRKEYGKEEACKHLVYSPPLKFD